MSIIKVAQKLVDAGRLIDRPSTMTGSSARTMLVTPDIDGIARRPFPQTFEGDRYAALARFLDGFCELDMMGVSEKPFSKPWDVMLARVHPPESGFWSMRITTPENTPGIRILGAFLAKDCFVSLKWDFREAMADFDSEVDEAGEIWGDHFGTLTPFKGRSLNEHLTNYYSVD